MNTRITYTGGLNIVFESVGQYIVTDYKLASYYVISIMKSLVGKTTFGSGFPTTYRKYPVLKINN